jgi:hypothetical protein
MTKKELFDKYKITEKHNKWDNVVDNWMSVEVFMEMHDGKLPEQDDYSIAYVLEFLDKMKNDLSYGMKILHGKNGGSLFLTAKRMVYCYADQILEEIAV